MSKQIDDFNASVPTSSSGSINRPIPASPSSITVAEFGLAVVTSSTNKVELIATVEFQSTAGAPQVLFQIFRDTAVIFSTQASTLAVNEIRNSSFLAIDTNVPIGYHAYSLTATVINPALNQATIVGPVTFSGMSIV